MFPTTRRAVLKYFGLAGLGTILANCQSNPFISKPVPSAPKSFRFDTPYLDINGTTINSRQNIATYFELPLTSEVMIKMVKIPAGNFLIGSPESESERFNSEGPNIQIEISEFYIGMYPITQAQWHIIANLPQIKTPLPTNSFAFKGDDRPVENINWYEAVEFCDRLSQLTLKKYRLPSIAEWEYAARATTTTAFAYGDSITSDLANYNAEYTYMNTPKGKYIGETTPVGKYPPNLFGLYDVHGNVWEMCLDQLVSNYNNYPTNGQPLILNQANKNIPRMLKGGSWTNAPRECRSASLLSVNPNNRDHNQGLRIVLSST